MTTPDPTTVPAHDWLYDAIEALISGAMQSVLTADAETALDTLKGATIRFAETCEANDETSLMPVHLATSTLAALAYAKAPTGMFGDGDGPMVMESLSELTGMVINPDDDLDPDDVHGHAMLLSMRWFVAGANDDDASLAALIHGAHEDLIPLALAYLAQYAAGIVLAGARERGELTPGAVALLDAAETNRPTRDAPRTGMVAVDPATAMPHGDGAYAIGVYWGTVRDAAAAQLGQAITGMQHRQDRLPLCGVNHAEDIQVWQAPKPMQRELTRALRACKRENGRPGSLVRVWQHYGPCLESMPAEDRDRLPGPDDVPLFDLDQS
jgi:hypothetical protein